MNPSTKFVVVLRNNANAPDQRANDLRMRMEEAPAEQRHIDIFILLEEG